MRVVIQNAGPHTGVTETVIEGDGISVTLVDDRGSAAIVWKGPLFTKEIVAARLNREGRRSVLTGVTVMDLSNSIGAKVSYTPVATGQKVPVEERPADSSELVKKPQVATGDGETKKGN